MVIIEGSSWLEDVSNVDRSYSSSVLTTTVATLVICLATCVREKTSKASTYNTLTSTCDCYDSLTTSTSVNGNRLWTRHIEGYLYNSQLGWYIKVVADQWNSHWDAESDCAADGGRLVVLDTVAKHTYITGLPEVLYDNYYHLGATDVAVEDTFVWSTGSVVSRQSFLWHGTQPDNRGSQNCLAIYKWLYDDVGCSSDMNFICELV
ncbi:C-type lectin domain family 4 member D-like [Pecten maximus]|uniref:C-type lectin domain family 4 member D-like n=1 Tax=Pecten maximus TaxID=6579 RepID=UPI0014587268|nr:C-type lectin domain family 4 member D-like [Pecten maximus]